MANLKPDKQIVVDEILSELDFGITYNDCLLLNRTKWQLADRTFVTYWNEARRRFSELSERTQIALEQVYIEGKKEALKKAILDKHERMEILTQIARGEIPLNKHIVCDGIIQERETLPAWGDRRAAIAELNKMDGEYAPIKKDITSGGEKITINFED